MHGYQMVQRQMAWSGLCLLILSMGLTTPLAFAAEEEEKAAEERKWASPFGSGGSFRHSEEWKCIAKQSLLDGDTKREVFLYLEDSDGFDGSILEIPNSLEIWAVYQEDESTWVVRRLIGFARVKYSKILNHSPKSIDIALQPYRVIVIGFNDDLDLDPIPPIHKRIHFVDGKLVAEGLEKDD